MAEPFLYNTVNTLYHGIMDHMPQWVQERDLASAFVLGTTGIATLVKGLQLASKHVVDKIIPGFDEKVLHVLEKICIAGMVAAPVLYSIMDPEGAKHIMQEHPTYTAGMTGVLVGSVGTALDNLKQRAKKL